MKFNTNKTLKIALGVILVAGSILLAEKKLRNGFAVPKIEDEPEIVKVETEPFTELIPGYGIVAHSGSEMTFEVGIDAADSQNVRVGQNALLFFQQQKKLVGKVTRILRNASSETYQSICWISAPNPDGKDHTGEFVWAKIQWISGTPVLVVPTSAIFVKEQKTWVVTGDKKPKEVEIGRNNDEKIEILSGLTKDDSVMTGGAIGYLYPDFKAGGGE